VNVIDTVVAEPPDVTTPRQSTLYVWFVAALVCVLVQEIVAPVLVGVPRVPGESSELPFSTITSLVFGVNDGVVRVVLSAPAESTSNEVTRVTISRPLYPLRLACMSA
jgi:hypothetical protein